MGLVSGMSVGWTPENQPVFFTRLTAWGFPGGPVVKKLLAV